MTDRTVVRQRRTGLPFVQHSGALSAVADLALISVSFLVATTVLHGSSTPDTASVQIVFLAMLALHSILGACLGLYRGRSRYGTFEQVQLLAVVVSATTATLLFLDLVIPNSLAERCVAATGVLAALLLLALRCTVRVLGERRFRKPISTARPVIVLGAGEGGAQLINAMRHEPRTPYEPVALLDDDPHRLRLRLSGVPVLGGRKDLARVAELTGARVLVIAIPTAEASFIRETVQQASALGIAVSVVPPVQELFDAPLAVSDIRSVTETDLLGRREISIDLASVARYLSKRRVLVTGAGGSIGSELCRQIRRYGPAELIMLERDESALHALQLSIESQALLGDRNLVVADIRDRERLFEIFADRRPDVVFHAAALKHLPLLEMHPAEAVKTNITGTLNVLEAALSNDVACFVNISTDKAADPSSVLGYTKRITERLTACAAMMCGRTYLSVRFGNVLGSRGSALPAFRAQIAAGNPVTVTDPDVTRYFMTVEEAVRLVVQSGAIATGGEVLVLDMGEPVRIAEIAKRLIDMSGRSVEIVYTGLRPGEKLHEVLLGAAEHGERRAHPMIDHVDVPPLDFGALNVLDLDQPAEQIVSLLHWLSYAPPLPPRSVTRAVGVAGKRSGDRSRGLLFGRAQEYAK